MPSTRSSLIAAAAADDISVAKGVRESREGGHPEREVLKVASGRCQQPVSDKAIVLLADEAPIVEHDEFRPLIAEGTERGFLTFEQIACCLEEADVTKEQVQE